LSRRIYPTHGPFAQTSPSEPCGTCWDLVSQFKNGMATLFKLFMTLIFFLAIFYSTTIMMSYLYALDSAPLLF
jgi:hypothetical protein